jgi:hypothetical protein
MSTYLETDCHYLDGRRLIFVSKEPRVNSREKLFCLLDSPFRIVERNRIALVARNQSQIFYFVQCFPKLNIYQPGFNQFKAEAGN